MTFLEAPAVRRDQLADLLGEAPAHLLIGDWGPAGRRGSFLVEKHGAMRLRAMCGV